MRALFIFSFVILIASCSSSEKTPDAKDSVPKNTAVVPAGPRVPIDSSGYTIELIPGYKIEEEKGDGMIYYFTPADTASKKGEGGLYIGPHPNERPPSTDYSKKEMLGILLGQSVNWTEYTTTTYTQREVFIDDGTGNKIHVWCYSNNLAELANLFKMMSSIQK